MQLLDDLTRNKKMERRDFLKTTVEASASLGLMPFKFDSDYDKLLKNLERSTIYDPCLGTIPFKPYNYQKKILRQIYDHNKVIFLKARQIGITTLFKNSGITEHQHRTFYVETSFEKTVAEEINFLHSFTQFQNLIINSGDKKTIIAGSVDNNGNMKWASENAHKYGFKFFIYNIHDCWHEYGKEKINQIEEHKNILTKEIWNQEYECVL